MADLAPKNGNGGGMWPALGKMGSSLIVSTMISRVMSSALPPWSAELMHTYGVWMVVAIFTGLGLWWFIPRNVFEKDHRTELSERLAIVETKIDTFYSMLQVRVGQLVKGKTHLRLDELMDKYRLKIATKEELDELTELLDMHSLDDIEKVQAAAIALSVIYIAEELLENAANGTLPTVTTELSPEHKAAAAEEQHEAEAQQIKDKERKPEKTVKE